MDYIVKNTVGHLIEGKTPKEIDKIKIADPACGSGSFLIGAYQYLLDYHKNYYTENGTKIGKKNSPITPEGSLTSNEKKRILLNNIYGVDIDTNAVEVTKLSLLLKCMEGETENSINQQYQLWHERILPTLDDNIKSGNSLIDTDFYDTKLDFGEDKKVKPFNWQNAFPNVFAKGGFDAVIGNPPYVRQELLGDQKDYFSKNYLVYHGVADLYSYFIERGIGLLKPNGLFGIIVANKWMRANYGEPLRRWLKKTAIKQIIDFGDLPVFQGITTYPCILLCQKNNTIGETEITNVQSLDFHNLDEYVNSKKILLNQSSLDDNSWNLTSNQEQNLLKKIQIAGVPLGEYVKGKIYYGIKTGLNEAFVIDQETKKHLMKEDKRSAEIIKPFLAGKDIKRYQPPISNKYLIFIRRGININNYPAIKNHLFQFKKQLTPKPKDFNGTKWEGRKPGSYKWYEIQDAVDYYDEFEKPKLMLPDIALRMQATLDTNKTYCVNTAYIIPVNDKYILAILNSNLIQFYYARLSSSIRGGYLRFIRQYLETIPIKVIDKENKEQNSIQNELIHNVDSLLQLNKEKQSATLQTQIDQIQSRIDYYEKKINLAFYQLYSLTEEEIKIIEDSIAK